MHVRESDIYAWQILIYVANNVKYLNIGFSDGGIVGPHSSVFDDKLAS
jgi:hypothetical protein